MRKNGKLWKALSSFGYEHKGFDDRVMRLRRSVGEINRILDNLMPGDKKDERK